MSNIESTPDGLVEISSGKKIISPLDRIAFINTVRNAKKIASKFNPIYMEGKVILGQESIDRHIARLNEVESLI